MNSYRFIAVKLLCRGYCKTVKPIKAKLSRNETHAFTIKIFLSSFIIFFSAFIGLAQPLPPEDPNANPVPFHSMACLALLVGSLLLISGRKKRTKPHN